LPFVDSEQEAVQYDSGTQWGSPDKPTGRRCTKEKPVVRLIVLAHQRPEALRRLLDSAQRADYSEVQNLCGIALDVFIDADEAGKVDDATASVADSFYWSHGAKRVVRRTTHHGRAKQWLTAWDPRRPEIGVLLEDDVELSPFFLRWVLAGHDRFAHADYFGGLALQRAADPGLSTEPFLFKRVGSLGFSPSRKVWLEFLEWHGTAAADPSFRPPRVDGTQNGKLTDQTWSQWFAHYCETHDLFTLYAVPSDATTLAAAHDGDAAPMTTWDPALLAFPDSIALLDWDAKVRLPPVPYCLFGFCCMGAFIIVFRFG
jgi:hypothetical protein